MDPLLNCRERDRIAKIRQALNDKKLVIIVGAGVSLNSISPPPSRITWIGLIQNGLNYLEEEKFPGTNAKDLKYHQKVLTRDNPNLRTVLLTCLYLKGELEHNKQFPTWLDSVLSTFIKKSVILKSSKLSANFIKRAQNS